MSLGIYKQGQGYWVRVMTAAALGIAFIAAAAWGWGQAGIVRLPAREWTLSLSNSRMIRGWARETRRAVPRVRGWVVC